MTDININEGDFYRHFKGQIYQIRAIATNSENNILMVVYQAMYPPFKTWVRPMSIFLEKLDKTKYPDTTQEYRFEKISFNSNSDSDLFTDNKNVDNKTTPDIFTLDDDFTNEKFSISDAEIREALLSGQVERKLAGKLSDKQIAQKGFMIFLDADNYHDKYHIFSSLRPYLNDTLLNNIAVTLDLILNEGSPEQHFDTILNCLMTHEHYECNRLR